MVKHLFHFLLFILSVFTGSFSFAQNLVPNPSFEVYDTCPTNTAQVEYAIGWDNFGKTPDYYNGCNSSLVSVPNNFVGYQPAATGQAYCGMQYFNINDSSYREYIGATLTNPLQIGQKYFVSGKFCLAGGNPYAIAINRLCIRFSIGAYSQSVPPPLDNFAHIISDSIITDTVNWYILKGSFIADSAYERIIIGNFFQNYLSDTLKLSSIAYTSYYLIDDVCVSIDSLTCNPEQGIGINEINDPMLNISIDPLNNLIHIQCLSEKRIEATIFITDILGQKIFIKKVNIGTSQDIEIENLKSSLYLLSIQANNHIQTTKFLKQ